MSQRSPITTHILDTAQGRPARGVPVTLERRVGASFEEVGAGRTDEDGRVTDLLRPGSLAAGEYRISFDTDAYYRSGAPAGRESAFYPRVTIDFRVGSTDEHYHVPLLLSPFGFSTYRGS